MLSIVFSSGCCFASAALTFPQPPFGFNISTFTLRDGQDAVVGSEALGSL